MNDQDRSRRHYSTVLIIIGAIIFLYPVLTEAYGAYAQYQLKAKWDQEISQQEKEAKFAELRQTTQAGKKMVSNENAVLTRVLSSGGDSDEEDRSASFPTTKITIPKINLEQVVVAGVDTEALKNGPGHYPGTPNPGQKGNVAIAGHRVTFTHPFNRIDELSAGDEIILETLEYIYVYKVEYNKVLDPNDAGMLAASGGAQLTLTTCTPKYSATNRLDVRAVLFKTTPRQKPTFLKRLIATFTPSRPEETPRNLLDLATSEARSSLQRNPRDSGAHLRLGAVYQAKHRYNLAKKEYRLAANLNPGDEQPHLQLGLLFEQTQDSSRAVEEYNRTLNLNSENDEAIFRLGKIYIKEKNYNQAVTILQRGVDLSPYSADLLYNLAYAMEKAGNRDGAIVNYEQALGFVPDYAEAKEGLKRLLSRKLNQ